MSLVRLECRGQTARELEEQLLRKMLFRSFWLIFKFSHVGQFEMRHNLEATLQLASGTLQHIT